MRKYENVDIVAALGAVVELNTSHYKSDFLYDIDRFKEAVQNLDGESNRLLWLSRECGTYCFPEREVYIKDTVAFNFWSGCATILGSDTPFENVVVNERVHAFAVEVKGMENGRIMGNLHELHYREHIRQLNHSALPLHTVTATYKDGTAVTLPHKELDRVHSELSHQHGQLQSRIPFTQDAGALNDVLKQVRERHEKDAQPAVFRLRVQNPKQRKPSIKEQLSTGKKQHGTDNVATPKRSVAKSKHTGLED